MSSLSGVSRWKKWIPALLILVSLMLNIVARLSTNFSNCYVNYIFPLWVETYGRLTGLFPFSVGEWMLYLAAILVALFVLGGIVYLIGIKKLPDKSKCIFRKYSYFLYWVLGVVCVIMTLNCFMLYQVSPVSERFGIGGGPERKYGIVEITALRDYVVEQANALSDSFERDEQGYIIYEKDLKEEAVSQMQRLGEQFSNLSGYYPKPKEFALSGFYSQQYIMGYYFPFSMEANYNNQMYITNMPTTMCHELSHLKGFILEDEANFIGYLACVDSEDPLFRYSAYLSVVGYLNRDFKEALGENQEVYLEHPQVNEQVKADRLFLTQEAWQQVEEKAVLPTETVRQASDTLLDTTLTLNGVEDGIISYSRVVKLLLQYYDGKLY